MDCRGVCMMRKNLNGPGDLDEMPSLLGHVFRVSHHGVDGFDYQRVLEGSPEAKLLAWQSCRNRLGMHLNPDRDTKERQQYMPTP